MNIKNKNLIPAHLEIGYLLTAKYQLSERTKNAYISGEDVSGERLKTSLPLDPRIPAKDTCLALARRWLEIHETRHPKKVWQEYHVFFLGKFHPSGYMVGVACYGEVPVWATKEN